MLCWLVLNLSIFRSKSKWVWQPFNPKFSWMVLMFEVSKQKSQACQLSTWVHKCHSCCHQPSFCPWTKTSIYLPICKCKHRLPINVDKQHSNVLLWELDHSLKQTQKKKKKTVPHVDKIAFISFVCSVFSDTLLFWRKLAPTLVIYGL